MSKLVTIFGGSGFVGRYIAQRLAANGWRVRVAVRRPNEAMFVRPYGVVGQVEPVFCNIRDDASVEAVTRGADAVVNCVGTFEKSGKNNFDAVQHEGAERVAHIAAKLGVSTLVHISALGIDRDDQSAYAASKRAGEDGILRHFPSAMILRPSVVFGPEDGFFNRFAGMTRMGPFFPLVGGQTEFQPVYVEDVALAAAMGAEGKAQGVYELGGPEAKSLRAWIDVILDVVKRHKIVINAPMWIGKLMAFSFDMLQAVTLGLFKNGLLTRDQAKQLAFDNTVSEGAKTFQDLGIEPVAAEAILDTYLWRYRPSGQYDEIRESAAHMRKPY